MKEYSIYAATVILVLGGVFFLNKFTHHQHVLSPTASTETNIVLNSNHLTALGEKIPTENNVKVIKQVTLTAENTILLIGEIGANQSLLGQEINEKAKSGNPIYILINSPGGSVLDGNMIVSAIQASTVPVYTICMQLCASMASIIFEMGTKRYMVDRSILMFHEASGEVKGQFNQMKSRLNIFDKIVSKLDTEIARRVGLDPDVFMAKLPNELWLDAEDAVKQNYADRLVNLNLIQLVRSNENVSNTLFKTYEFKKSVDVKLNK